MNSIITHPTVCQAIIRVQGTSSEWGRRGTIIEVAEDSKRARIDWEPYWNGDKRPRTWIKIEAIVTGDTFTDEQIKSTKVAMRAAKEARFKSKYGHLS